MSKLHFVVFLRFLMVGALSALLNTLIIVALTEILGLHYLVSFAVCFVLVNSVGFFLNRQWSFKMKGEAWRQEFALYLAVSLVAVAVAMAVSDLLVHLGFVYYFAVYLAAAVLAPANFFAHRLITFGRASCNV